MASPIFIDIEASALRDGFPIELGWATIEQLTGRVISDAVLINPNETQWPARHIWDAAAECLHRISRHELSARGLSPAIVIQKFEATLAEAREVYSDSVEMDGPWLGMLYDQARVPVTVKLRTAQSLVVGLADARGMGDLDFTAAEVEARRRAGPRHRAAPDAAYWAHLWSLICECYRAPPGARPVFGYTRFGRR